jgi:hypothetical protein
MGLKSKLIGKPLNLEPGTLNRATLLLALREEIHDALGLMCGGRA